MRRSGRKGGLPDHIRPGARVLFVGINPGLRSAAVGHHFAGPSNRFWRLMCESGLLPERLGWADDARLPLYGYGITNLVRRCAPGNTGAGGARSSFASGVTGPKSWPWWD